MSERDDLISDIFSKLAICVLAAEDLPPQTTPVYGDSEVRQNRNAQIRKHLQTVAGELRQVLELPSVEEIRETVAGAKLERDRHLGAVSE